jgi:hypothetical protein
LNRAALLSNDLLGAGYCTEVMQGNVQTLAFLLIGLIIVS